jgi:hypothetical protein
VPITAIVPRLRRPVALPLILSGLFVAAGGFVHLREWLDTYRHVPASLPGAEVVRVGFVLNAVVSAVLLVALLAALFVGRRAVAVVLASAALFEAGSLATLVQTRRGTVFGWMERGWTLGASQTGAVEIGALCMLAAAAATLSRAPGDRWPSPEPVADTSDGLDARAPALCVVGAEAPGPLRVAAARSSVERPAAAPWPRGPRPGCGEDAPCGAAMRVVEY